MRTFLLLPFALLTFAASAQNGQITTQKHVRRDSPAIWKDPSKPISARVDDLVSRMTLQEKIGQMINGAPAIPRLGIPRYEWWSEALHGVLKPAPCTSFPEPIGLGATFDTDLELRIAT